MRPVLLSPPRWLRAPPNLLFNCGSLCAFFHRDCRAFSVPSVRPFSLVFSPSVPCFFLSCIVPRQHLSRTASLLFSRPFLVRWCFSLQFTSVAAQRGCVSPGSPHFEGFRHLCPSSPRIAATMPGDLVASCPPVPRLIPSPHSFPRLFPPRSLDLFFAFLRTAFSAPQRALLSSAPLQISPSRLCPLAGAPSASSCFLRPFTEFLHHMSLPLAAHPARFAQIALAAIADAAPLSDHLDDVARERASLPRASTVQCSRIVDGASRNSPPVPVRWTLLLHPTPLHSVSSLRARFRPRFHSSHLGTPTSMRASPAGLALSLRTCQISPRFFFFSSLLHCHPCQFVFARRPSSSRSISLFTAFDQSRRFCT